GRRCGPADRVARRRLDVDAALAVRHGAGPGLIGADQVADDLVGAGRGTLDQNAGAGVAGDQVAGAGAFATHGHAGGAADRVAQAGDLDAGPVGVGRRAGRV